MSGCIDCPASCKGRVSVLLERDHHRVRLTDQIRGSQQALVFFLQPSCSQSTCLPGNSCCLPSSRQLKFDTVPQTSSVSSLLAILIIGGIGTDKFHGVEVASAGAGDLLLC